MPNILLPDTNDQTSGDIPESQWAASDNDFIYQQFQSAWHTLPTVQAHDTELYLRERGATAQTQDLWDNYHPSWMHEPGVDELGRKMSYSKMLSADEANDRYSVPGAVKFDQPIRENAAKILHDIHHDEQVRNQIINQSEPGLGTATMGVGVQFATQLMDPLNVAAMMIPFIGEAREASWAAKFGKGASRIASGAVNGALGNALLEPVHLYASEQLQEEYGPMDALMNTVFSSALSAGLHFGFGKIGDMIESGRIKAETHEASLRTAVAHLGQGQEVNVEPILDKSGELKVKSAEDSAGVFEKHLDELDTAKAIAKEAEDARVAAEDELFKLTDEKSDVALAQRENGMKINALEAKVQSGETLTKAEGEELMKRYDLINKLQDARSTEQYAHSLSDELAPESRAAMTEDEIARLRSTAEAQASSDRSADLKASSSIEERLSQLPETYDDVDIAQEHLDEILSQMDEHHASEADIQQLQAYDDEITKAKKMGDVIQQAATCVITESI